MEQCSIQFHSMEQCSIHFHSMEQCSIQFHSMEQCSIQFHSMEQCMGREWGDQHWTEALVSVQQTTLITNVLSECAGVEIHSFRSHIRGSLCFGVEIHAQNSGIHSQKGDSDRYFGVDSTILSVDFFSNLKWSLIWLLKEWISTPLH